MYDLSWQRDFYLTILMSVGPCRAAEINRREIDYNGDDYNHVDGDYNNDDHNLTALTIHLELIPDEQVHNSDIDPVKCAIICYFSQRKDIQGPKDPVFFQSIYIKHLSRCLSTLASSAVSATKEMLPALGSKSGGNNRSITRYVLN